MVCRVRDGADKWHTVKACDGHRAAWAAFSGSDGANPVAAGSLRYFAGGHARTANTLKPGPDLSEVKT